MVGDMLKAYDNGVAFYRIATTRVTFSDGIERNGHISAAFLTGAKDRAIGRKLWLGLAGSKSTALGFASETVHAPKEIEARNRTAARLLSASGGGGPKPRLQSRSYGRRAPLRAGGSRQLRDGHLRPHRR